jgi:hypothetical protein
MVEIGTLNIEKLAIKSHGTGLPYLILLVFCKVSNLISLDTDNNEIIVVTSLIKLRQ